METEDKEERRSDLPLEGVRILDIGTALAGPSGPTLLADFGAEVIKVEEPEKGDIIRNGLPQYEGHGVRWRVDGRGKKAITLDLRKLEDQEKLRRLVCVSDAVVENFRAGTLERWNLSYEDLKIANEEIILVRVTGFGQEGPYRRRTAYDRMGVAMGGLSHVTGEPDRPPVRPGFAIGDYTTATFNALATLLALYWRDAHGGTGQWADVSLYESIFRLTEASALAFDKLGVVRERTGNHHPATRIGGIYRTQCGRWVTMEIFTEKALRALGAILGRNGSSLEGQVGNELIKRWVSSRTLEELRAALEGSPVPFSPVYSVEDILADPHYQARGEIIEIEDPVLGRTRMQGVFPRLSRTPGKVRHPAAFLGEHNAEIPRWLAEEPKNGKNGKRPQGATDRPRLSASASTPHALEGIRVLQLGTGLPTSFAGSILGEFGAEVIVVEPPSQGDPLRRLPPFFDGHSLWWALEGRNKRSITLDLRRPKGQEFFQKLAKNADVVIEGFRPGTMERWGLGYEALAATNSGIILVRISDFGQEGPYRDRPGSDGVAQAMSGASFTTGYQDGPPIRCGLAIGCYLAGLFGVVGTMIALYERDAKGTGKGQWIDVSLYGGLFRLSGIVVTQYDKLRIVEERMGNRTSRSPMDDIYLTGDGKLMTILATSDEMFSRVAQAIGREELIEDPRFQTILLRAENADPLHTIVKDWIGSHTLKEAVEAFDQAAVPYSPLYTIKDLFEDPHCQIRQNLVEVVDPHLGRVKMPGVTPRLSQTPGTIRFAAPELGQHNEEVYGELLDLGWEELGALRQEGII